ncbi:MAG: hypothetical protein RBG13Loki_3499 [Promethearchaeota archaeon CR_4]|nr:MAG: hypothetical protein RBG13Loki_3499 [Candidatus Lokiarchaeota archaeon CR_4]
MKEKIYDVSDPKQPFIDEAPVLIVPIIDANQSLLPVPDLSLAS